MNDLEITRLCAEAMGWKHLGAIGTGERNESNPGDTRPYCLSGANDWWQDPHGFMVCEPCTGSVPNPLHDDARAMALGKKFPEIFSRAVQEWVWRLDHGETGFDLNYHFCDRVAKMQSAKEPA